MKGYLYKLKYSSFILFFLCLLLVNSPYLGQRFNNLIKLCIEFILVISIFLIEYKFTKNVFQKCVPIFLFFIGMCLSTYFCYGISSRFFNSLVTGGLYWLFYLIIVLFVEKYSYRYVVDIIKKNILFYMLILDVFVILTLGKGLGGSGLGGKIEEAVYLIGNKFMVSYLHMAIIALINCSKNKIFQNRKKICRIMFFLIYSLVICKLADTTTGIIGCVLVAVIQIILIYKPKFINLLSNPLSVLIFFFSINIILLLTDFILENEFFTSFFLSISHTSTILSGRVKMYNISIEAIIKKPIWGYGINYDIVREILSFGNPQNGLLKILLDYGIVGMILFSLVLFNTFKNVDRASDYYFSQGIIAFVYAMLFCSLVEINLSSIFILMCALLNGKDVKKSKAKSDKLKRGYAYVH